MQVLHLFLIELLVFLPFNCLNSLCILDIINSLLDMWFVNIFSYSVCFPSTLLRPTLYRHFLA